MTESPFHYRTGEEVCAGDRVIAEGRRYGVVEYITLPGTEIAAAESAPTGGITIVENVEGRAGYWFATPNDEVGEPEWDDTVFLFRGRVLEPPDGISGYPWPYEPGPFNGGVRGEDQDFRVKP